MLPGDEQVFQIGVGEPKGCLIPPLCHLSAPSLDEVPPVPWGISSFLLSAVGQIMSRTEEGIYIRDPTERVQGSHGHQGKHSVSQVHEACCLL